MFTPAQARFGLDRFRVPRDLRRASIMCALAIAAGVAGAFSASGLAPALLHHASGPAPKRHSTEILQIRVWQAQRDVMNDTVA
ncbi:MAG: hypothetical protein ACR2KT_08565, partial [Methylocella sp.]